MVLADLNIGGKPTKVLMDANRNGFFYVLDRTNGKLIAANQYIQKQTWAKGIDETGRPIPSEISDKVRKGEAQEVWPGAMGARTGVRFHSTPTPASSMPTPSILVCTTSRQQRNGVPV
jgi:alcohol dehydrogenase (cytochrome c)